MDRMYRSAMVLVLAMGVLLIAAAESRACSCMGDEHVRDAFGQASAVFVGEVVGAGEQKTHKDQNGVVTVYDVGTIYFTIQEAFSGVEGKRKVTIHSGTGGGDCGYWFQRNRRYLIYAYGDAKDGYEASLCTRTAPLEDANEDLTILRQLPAKGSGVAISGWVSEWGALNDDNLTLAHRRVPDIPITIKGPQRKPIRLRTDANGGYQVNGLRPGEYEITASLPEVYEQDYLVTKVTIRDRGRATVSFAAIPDNRISGRVVDAEGNPVRKAKVVLITPQQAPLVGSDREIANELVNDTDGSFEFYRVATGEYLLGINLSESPDNELPYPPTYFPGVQDPSQAASIALGIGDRWTDLVLRLPGKLRERVIRGTVVWPDGKPAVGALVYLADPRWPRWPSNGTVNTDALGQFTLIGFEGYEYWVVAGIDAPRPAHSEPPRTGRNGEINGLRLVLTAEGDGCEHYYDPDK
jgi:hypothetical protein